MRMPVTMPDLTLSIELADVSKAYQRGGSEVVALRDVSLAVPRGEFLSVMGPSGSGKSTFLNLIAGLDIATSGEVYVAGRALREMSDDALTDLRQTQVGVIFQFFNLLPNITALDNVALPLRALGGARRTTEEKALEALARVGLNGRAHHRPIQLSGGEMQRVAIARALVIDPSIILADEPTGNLDSLAGAEILDLLREHNRERGVTVVLVTHSPIAAAYGDRVITLRDGQIVDEVITRPEKPAPHLRPVS
jgi:putative ABC transport system ATP-binding protein